MDTNGVYIFVNWFWTTLNGIYIKITRNTKLYYQTNFKKNQFYKNISRARALVRIIGPISYESIKIIPYNYTY